MFRYSGSYDDSGKIGDSYGESMEESVGGWKQHMMMDVNALGYDDSVPGEWDGRGTPEDESHDESMDHEYWPGGEGHYEM